MFGMSVQTTNNLSNLTLTAGFASAAMALAAVVIESPIGALGGAIFGAVHVVSQIPLIKCGNNVLNAEHPQASSAAKTFAKALQILGSYGAAWGVLALAGFSLTLSHVVTLAFVSLFTSACLGIAIDCFAHKERRVWI